MAKVSTKLLPPFIFLMSVAAAYVLLTRPCETQTMTAYRICARCGLENMSKVDLLIENARNSKLTRDQQHALFYQVAVGDDVDKAFCEPCLQAVLDAVGIRSRDR